MTRLPAEWEEQEYVMVVFPTNQTDWQHSIKKIQKEYVDFIKTITLFEKCIVLCDDISVPSLYLKDVDNIEYIRIETNDTWIRDFGAICIYKNGILERYNFKFNAWGEKFDYSLDNMVNHKLLKAGFFSSLEDIDFILEGGSIDSNGDGVMLTTAKSIFNKNRNKNLTKDEILNRLKKLFNLKKIIVLKSGELEGDDTDAHIDTLARFIDKKTIVYTKCYDKDDIHFNTLNRMENELKRTDYNLIPIPLPSAKIFNNERLPATYINFLFVNGALIVPQYNDRYDNEVIDIFKRLLPSREIVGVSASIFIREHGSLHCASINFYNKEI